MERIACIEFYKLLQLSYAILQKNPSARNATYKPAQVNCILSKDLDSARLYITGTWNWLEEKRLDRSQQKFVYLTPQNQGFHRTLDFRNDTARYSTTNHIDSVYTYKIVLLKEISGTNFPEDNDPVLAFYSTWTGQRVSYTPIKICKEYLLLQLQYVSSISGEQIWKKQ